MIPIVLIGLMGAGKTTIGKQLAKRLGRPHEDSDDAIVKKAGCTIADLFERRGEAEFRRLEREIIPDLLQRHDLVLSVGGGAFMDADIRALTRKMAVVVWLQADLTTLMDRIRHDRQRPLLHSTDPEGTMRRLIEQRDPVYAEADFSIDATQEPRIIVAEIRRRMKAIGAK